MSRLVSPCAEPVVAVPSGTEDVRRGDPLGQSDVRVPGVPEHEDHDGQGSDEQHAAAAGAHRCSVAVGTGRGLGGRWISMSVRCAFRNTACARLPASSIMELPTSNPAAPGDHPMSHYRSNVRDLEFALFEVFGPRRRARPGPVRGRRRRHRARDAARGRPAGRARAGRAACSTPTATRRSTTR